MPPDEDDEDMTDCVACEVRSITGHDYGREHTCAEVDEDLPGCPLCGLTRGHIHYDI